MGNSIITNINPDDGVIEPGEQIKNIWDKLPLDTPFMGAYNNYGSRTYWGFIYGARQYGSVIVQDYTGRMIHVLRDTGVFTSKDYKQAITKRDIEGGIDFNQVALVLENGVYKLHFYKDGAWIVAIP